MFNRRSFLFTSGAALSARALPTIGRKLGERRIVTLVYDKALGGLRAVERVVFR